MARFEIPEGWTAQACRYALDPAPVQERAFRSRAGGARKAHNTMLGLVKAVMDQRAAERSYGIAGAGLTPALDWSLAGLRKKWNACKGEVAPWWAENSKEACNTGLDALARGLDAWSKSRTGERAGKGDRLSGTEVGPFPAVGAVHDRDDPGGGWPAPRHPANSGHDRHA
jgi:putative transposase